VNVPATLLSPRVVGLATIACVAFMSPVLYAMRAQPHDASWIRPKIFWRSSSPGVDALAFLLPNPNHAWFGGWSEQWLTHRPNGLAENTASLTFVALLTIGIAYSAYRFRRGRLWVAITVFFAWLSLGPFIFISGVNTQIPTPWALLRYLPIVGGARMPARLSVLVMLGFALLFACALKRIAAAHRRHRVRVLLGVGVLLLFELAPMPRRLYAATIPRIYQIVASDTRAIRVLEVPFGIRDGLSSYGNFSAESLLYQTAHEKPLIGGYLSRVPRNEVDRYRRRPVIDALITLSEGRPLTERQALRVRRRGPGFVERARIGYVVIDMNRTSPQDAAFIEDALQLAPVGEDQGKRLYRTRCCRSRKLPLKELGR
jgi:hypothetical protein